jgi:hypothetical protein
MLVKIHDLLYLSAYMNKLFHIYSVLINNLDEEIMIENNNRINGLWIGYFLIL